ncbi:ATP-binding protein [Bacteroides sp. An19]|uniref:ATP-binding protein n=2 Tax=Bacteroides TaxID=816 RepID=UPI000B39555E|nr:ATP-binding protein [Bacteroides sp. An19]OUP28963.1 AAA family ATPase [Bacteroides sp. An19]
MKFPIGIQSFEKMITEGYCYVDKTDLLYQLVKEGAIYFLSRPRRFGKSLLVSTLKNYFSGKKELFKGLAIEKLETEWKEYPVFHIDFNGSNFTVPGTLEDILEGTIKGWEREYGKSQDYTDIGKRFAYVLKQAHKQSGRRCVVLIDEYDKPILDVLDTGIKGEQEETLLEDRNREVLKGFYSVFKAADDDLQFVLLTGVTKFSQVSVFNGFNQPADISMDIRYEALCGITQKELEHYFAGPISDMADREGISKEEMTGLLKRQYDGYHFSKAMTDIYNPFSLLNAFATRDMQDYWFRSGTPSYLIRLLAHTDENLDELTGKYYDPQEFVDYKANVEKPLPMIYQSGYLTIKDYKPRRGTFLLDFPNNEVKKGFVSLVASDYFKPQRENVNSWIQDLIDALEEGDTDKLHKLFTSFLADIPYTMRRKQDERERERYFHYTFYLIFRLVSVYTVYTEKEQSEGRVDCIVETPDYVYIFEFKLDGSADEALRQIEEKGYARPYASDRRLIYKIGASFSSQTGTIDDWKIQG